MVRLVGAEMRRIQPASRVMNVQRIEVLRARKELLKVGTWCGSICTRMCCHCRPVWGAWWALRDTRGISWCWGTTDGEWRSSGTSVQGGCRILLGTDRQIGLFAQGEVKTSGNSKAVAVQHSQKSDNDPFTI